jgi:hypothetical protein
MADGDSMEFADTRGCNLRDSEAITLTLGIAQAKYLGHTPRNGYKSDYEQIGELNYYEDPQRRYLWKRLRHLDAKFLVDRWWPQIQAVAAALIEKRRSATMTYGKSSGPVPEH